MSLTVERAFIRIAKTLEQLPDDEARNRVVKAIAILAGVIPVSSVPAGDPDREWNDLQAGKHFAQWFAENYPSESVITDPEWHSQRIWNAVHGARQWAASVGSTPPIETAAEPPSVPASRVGAEPALPPKVTCYACQREQPYHEMYRCFQCRCWFDESCMAVHLTSTHNFGGDRATLTKRADEGFAAHAASFAALQAISMLTPLNGEVDNYQDVVEAVRALTTEADRARADSERWDAFEMRLRQRRRIRFSLDYGNDDDPDPFLVYDADWHRTLGTGHDVRNAIDDWLWPDEGPPAARAAASTRENPHE